MRVSARCRQQEAQGSGEQGAGFILNRLSERILHNGTRPHTRSDLEGKHAEGAQSRTNKPTLERIGGKKERGGSRVQVLRQQ